MPRPRQSSRAHRHMPEFNVNSTIVIVTKDSELQNVVNAIVDSASWFSRRGCKYSYQT
jgi:hypothetical protein